MLLLLLPMGMAPPPPSHFHFLLILSILFTTSTATDHLTAFILPIAKNPVTLQYTTQISQRTPPVSIEVVLDLSTQLLWVGHDSGYNSSSFRQSTCNSTECLLVANDARKTSYSQSQRNPKCVQDICTITTWNSAFNTVMVGNLSQDTISLPSTDGITQGSMVSTPFVFSSTQSLQAFTYIQGIAGLGGNQLALPTQLATSFNLTRKFALCLPPSVSNGVIFFGDGPYAFLPGIDASKLLVYTPLITITKNPRETNHTHQQGKAPPLPLDEYSIWVRSIEVNGKRVSLNSSLLGPAAVGGKGGTKLSTIHPYTQMESSIYRSFTRLFIREARASNLTRARAVEPFKVCYRTKTNSGFRPAMPTIDLILQAEEVFWRVFETNSMVPVGGEGSDVACLGFLDGGVDPPEGNSMVIGGHQLEDNLLQFDLENWRLGFTSTLLLRETSCANFDFAPRAS